MAIPVAFSPKRLDFGSVPPDSEGPDVTLDPSFPADAISFEGGTVTTAPAGANVTASILDDTSHFKIRDISILHFVTRDVDPNELPHGHQGPLPKERVLELIAQGDGSLALPVEKGQLVLVRVKYLASGSEGAFTGTLVIQGDTWEPVQVPLSLSLAEVTTIVSDTVITISQGQSFDLPIDIRSLVGPDTDVAYELSRLQLHTGISLVPTSFHILRGETRSENLTLQASPDAPLGENTIFVRQLGFFRRKSFPVFLDVIPAPLPLPVPTPFVTVLFNEGATVDLKNFSETVAVRVQLPQGKYMVFGNVIVGNVDSDTQHASVRLTSKDGSNIMDSTDVVLGKIKTGPLLQTVSVQGLLTVDQEDIVDLRCATFHGFARQATLIAIGGNVDGLFAGPFANLPLAGVILGRFDDTVVVRGQVPRGQYVAFGKVCVENVDPDPQNSTVRLTSKDGSNIVDATDIRIGGTPGLFVDDPPHSVSGITLSVRVLGGLTVDQEDMVDLRCATFAGTAQHGTVIAMRVDSLMFSPPSL